ncbi:MAG TPA: VIT domain-containing protein, partial [Tepidisphaeraceae bacterium]|nr:VIT domain-containing protein [Tepidisphaeraceae bacterium]
VGDDGPALSLGLRNPPSEIPEEGRHRRDPHAAILVLLLAAFLAGCSAGHMPVQTTASLHGAAPGPGGSSLADLGLPAQSLPAPGEELWIIEKPGAGVAAPSGMADMAGLRPGSGMLLGVHGRQLSPFPLEHTDVNATIDGCIATVDVRQRFTNSSRATAEAVYVFPLPGNAAVSEFVMTLGRRRIRGIVREREEARKIYREARSMGFLASLLVQQGPNLFVQRIANLAPGGKIDVQIRYFHTLVYRDGAFEFEFPLIAGPRGNGWPKTRQRDGRDISLAVHIKAGVPIEKIESPTHEFAVSYGAGNTAADATLAPADHISNADLTLRYVLAGKAMKSALMTAPDGDGGALALLLIPPNAPLDLPRQPLQMIFAIAPDTGRGGGAAAARLLGALRAEDTFQIIRPMAGAARSATSAPVAATPGNVQRFTRELSMPSSNGMGAGELLHAAFSQPRDTGRARFVCLFTSGSGSLHDALCAIPQDMASDHLIAVGVGSAARHEAIDAIARAGRGAAVYLNEGADSASMFSDLTRRLSHPALIGARIDWNGADVSEVFPRPAPDLFAGHAVMLMGRYHGTPPASITLRGSVGGAARQWTVRAQAHEMPGEHSAIPAVWARMKIADLAARAVCEPNALLAEQVREVALEYGLVSRYTSFVCVDALTRTDLGEEHGH